MEEMMPPTMSGTELTLNSGDYSARIVTVGAGIAGLRLRSVDLVHPHLADELPDAYLGKTLVPWPNRIAGGTFTWRGQQYDVPVNEIETGCALHGLMSWVDWQIIHSDRDSATLGAFIAPRYGYPWALQSWVTYAIQRDVGLSVSITTKNVGTQTAPYGASSHPYLTLGLGRVDDFHLTLPAASVCEVDDSLIPVAVRDVGDLDLDYRGGRQVHDQRIDHAFTDLPDGKWAVRIAGAYGSWVELESDARWVQLYTGEKIGRHSIAVEPMTCAPNSFNSGVGLIELEPGQTHNLSFTIRGHIA